MSGPESMRAAIYHGQGDVRVERWPVPEPGPGEVLLAVAIAGVCGSDLAEYRSGPHLVHVGEEPHPRSGHSGPIVLGHEFGGYVVDRADDVDLEVGTLVACGAGLSCGECRFCVRGRTNLCERYFTAGLHRDGGLAEYCVVPADTCVDASALGADAWMAGLAQPMAIAVHSYRRGEVGPGDRVAVFGAGGIGAFLTYAAASEGVSVDVFDVNEERLALARDLGAASTVNIETTDAGAGERWYDCIYEVSGRESALRTSLGMASPGGRIVMVGVQAPGTGVEARDVTLAEITLVGTSAHAVGADLPEALRILATRDSWADIAPAAHPLDQLVKEGLDRSTPGPVKVLFAPWSEETVDAGAGLGDIDGKVVMV